MKWHRYFGLATVFTPSGVDGLLIEVLELRGCSRRQVPTNMRMPHQPTATLSPSLLSTVVVAVCSFLQPSSHNLLVLSFRRFPLLLSPSSHTRVPFLSFLQPFAPDYRSPVCPADCSVLPPFLFFLLISFSPFFSHFRLLCLVFLDGFSLPVLCSVCFWSSLSLSLSRKLLLYLKYIQYDQWKDEEELCHRQMSRLFTYKKIQSTHISSSYIYSLLIWESSYSFFSPLNHCSFFVLFTLSHFVVVPYTSIMLYHIYPLYILMFFYKIIHKTVIEMLPLASNYCDFISLTTDRDTCSTVHFTVVPF